jgi:hypothetical protein
MLGFTTFFATFHLPKSLPARKLDLQGARGSVWLPLLRVFCCFAHFLPKDRIAWELIPCFRKLEQLLSAWKEYKELPKIKR